MYKVFLWAFRIIWCPTKEGLPRWLVLHVQSQGGTLRDVWCALSYLGDPSLPYKYRWTWSRHTIQEQSSIPLSSCQLQRVSSISLHKDTSRPRGCLEAFSCCFLLQAHCSSNIHGSRSSTWRYPICSKTRFWSCSISHQPSKLRCSPFHRKYLCIQKPVEGYRVEPRQVLKFPQDCGWDGWKIFSYYLQRLGMLWYRACGARSKVSLFRMAIIIVLIWFLYSARNVLRFCIFMSLRPLGKEVSRISF